jgi:DNA modification methylase
MQLLNGDCLQEMLTIPDKTVDLILTDLPYGTTACKWDTIIPFEPLWAQYKRIIKGHGAIVLTASQPFTSILTCSNLPMYRYDWYWQKDKGSNFLFGNKMPLKNVETISVFYKAQPTYNPQKTLNPKGTSKRHLSFNTGIGNSDKAKEIMPNMPDRPKVGKNYEPDMLLPKQLIYFAREQRGKLHPTQKPVALMEYLIRTYTNEGDLVVDSCMGSGTTGVACVNTKREFIGIEKDTCIFDGAAKRIGIATHERLQLLL